jgi:adenosyl cobinamide kinase/adenosyl cobinamide phosphate guanylyltransferase
MTSTILDNYSKHIANIDQAKLEEARELLRRHRMVAISGPAKSGKTSTAVALAKSYMPDEVLFLHSPDDIRNIDFSTTLMVVIDDFGGKYRFDWMEVNKWFTCFDLLHEAVIAGKLNVVVTCETSMLQNCIKEVAMHPLLSYLLQLTNNKMLIKQELLGYSITSSKCNVS